MNIRDRVAMRDITLFQHIEIQTSAADRITFLALHDAVAKALHEFSYLEIGSHLGGTLQVFIADPRCIGAVSIDPRPERQPDDRGQVFEYPGNSTHRMLALLAQVPHADLSKLPTIERSTEDISPQELSRPDVAFIDGEHTYGAALRDARSCRGVMGDSGLVVFHDSWLIGTAIAAFAAECTPADAYPAYDGMYLVELGGQSHILSDPLVAERAIKAN